MAAANFGRKVEWAHTDTEAYIQGRGRDSLRNRFHPPGFEVLGQGMVIPPAPSHIHRSALHGCSIKEAGKLTIPPLSGARVAGDQHSLEPRAVR